MKKLPFSQKGYFRKMQISSATAFVFTEGFAPDRYFFSQLIENDSFITQYQVQIITADELYNQVGGGKKTLIEFFNFLQNRNALLNEFRGKKSISIFFLDKDVDDLKGTIINSEHIVYTETYELENYLFIYGDIAGVSAASTSLDLRSVKSILGDPHQWRVSVANSWKDWVKLCICANNQTSNCACNYGQKESQINDGISTKIMKRKYASYMKELVKISGKSKPEFDKVFKGISQTVDTLYSSGEYDKVFKGKWYLVFLVRSLIKYKSKKKLKQVALGEKIISGLAYSLDPKGQWTSHFLTPIRQFLTKSGSPGSV